MKVTNWRKKLLASLVAGGAVAPGVSYAIDIPLGDPSFEAFGVPASPGYAYANVYRPTSAWVDDLDSPAGYTQDDAASNWLYDAAYAESTTFTKRPAPRTGNQAMHGLFNYNAQETAALFEAGRTYTFSMWAQNDELLNETNGVFLYIFDGTVAFSDDNALAGNLFSEINQRTGGMTAVQSQANWTQLSISHTVSAGAPEIGHPVGVGFFSRKDSAVDDAALEHLDASTQVLVVEVNTTNGQVRLRNQTGAPVNIDYYEIASTTNALNATAWNSLQEQNLAGFPAGNGTGNGWEQAGGSSSGVVSESYLTGSSAVTNNATINLGAAFNVGGQQNLVFQYGALASAPNPTGDYNNNGTVDAADYVQWRNGGPLSNDPTPGVQPGDYTVWRANFGLTGGPTGPSTLTTGFVRYVTTFSGAGLATAVPEPTSVILIGIGIATLAVGRRRKMDCN